MKIVNASKKKWLGLDWYCRHKPHRFEIGKAGIIWDSRPTARYNYDQVESFGLVDPIDNGRYVPSGGMMLIKFIFKDKEWVMVLYDISNNYGMDLWEIQEEDMKENGIKDNTDSISIEMKELAL
jgi:hypothetical protein|tara:strand:- start:98 stop:469 length:372 start_codon:yes stop_codon:yes gene_type:complete